MPAALPVSGAWRPGDPPGRRRFARLAVDRPFVLEGGGQLGDIAIAYETWGELAADGDNAILVCHALTGDTHAAGTMGPGHAAPGWWDGLIGPGRAIDTDRWFVVCANVLGGCQGSTGPASADPRRGGERRYGSAFPVVSIRDIVRTQTAVARDLGVLRWLSVIGGSMGGMQVLEWGVMFPERVRSLVPIATAAAASAQQIAFGSAGRKAIRLDPRWRGGDYYEAAPGDGPTEGLSIARSIAQITYRSDDVFTDRFGREVVEPLDGFSLWQRFEVERYLEYHGAKLARRFDANSYLCLTKAMDLHDLARGRGGIDEALARIAVPTLVVGISSDSLYPTYQQRLVRDVLHDKGTPSDYFEIDSHHGHDAFLIDLDQLGPPLARFLSDVDKSGG
ncbi:MAG: homoserine O-acetyltransferase [Actinomycetota bacterium]|nr:homoserine O-acetyltransferase [Actinomycetota bacterium]